MYIEIFAETGDWIQANFTTGKQFGFLGLSVEILLNFTETSQLTVRWSVVVFRIWMREEGVNSSIVEDGMSFSRQGHSLHFHKMPQNIAKSTRGLFVGFQGHKVVSVNLT